MLIDYFKLKAWKIISLLIIYSYSLLQIREKICSVCKGSDCSGCYPFIIKFMIYAGQVALPGTTQLMRDNGFLVGYKTWGIWDAIPQLIFHIGIDIFYWYLIICLIVFLVNKMRTRSAPMQ